MKRIFIFLLILPILLLLAIYGNTQSLLAVGNTNFPVNDNYNGSVNAAINGG